MPTDVRKRFALPSGFKNFRAAPLTIGRSPKPNAELVGRPKAFRTSGGRAANLKDFLGKPTAFKAFALFAGLLLTAACSPHVSPPAARAESPRDPVSSITQDRSPLKLPLVSPRLVVKKADRQMFLYSANRLVRTYRIGLGLSPVGDKVRQGDRRTPLGDFYVFTKNDKSAFYLSLGLSYPNAPHAERGLREGLINKTQYESIMRALRAKRAPPQNTALGGDIYIHGNGAGSDWTWGCVALENDDIRELFNAVSVGTPVTIEP